MKQFSLETRLKMSEAAKKRCGEWVRRQAESRRMDLPYDEVLRLYESGHTQVEIGQIFGCSQKVVFGFMKRNGIKARIAKKRNQYGENNSNWKNGRRSNGKYIRIKTPDDSYSKPLDGYILEHVYVMEQHLGRSLRNFGRGDIRTEIVHHINEVKTDNRIENLMLTNCVEHMKIHNELRRRRCQCQKD
jgi:hypothetical protein